MQPGGRARPFIPSVRAKAYHVKVVKRGSRVLVAAMTCAMLAPAAPALGAAGDLDPSFGGDGRVATNLTAGNDAANAVAIQADGKVVVAGRTTGGGGQIVVARYTAAGLL